MEQNIKAVRNRVQRLVAKADVTALEAALRSQLIAAVSRDFATQVL
jgi:hypothetical protein